MSLRKRSRQFCRPINISQYVNSRSTIMISSRQVCRSPAQYCSRCSSHEEIQNVTVFVCCMVVSIYASFTRLMSACSRDHGQSNSKKHIHHLKLNTNAYYNPALTTVNHDNFRHMKFSQILRVG